MTGMFYCDITHIDPQWLLESKNARTGKPGVCALSQINLPQQLGQAVTGHHGCADQETEVSHCPN